MEPYTVKRARGDSVYYTVYWSSLRKADKHDIHRTVPSMSGIYELYYLDTKRALNLFYLAMAWYGGLRGSIREKTDVEIERDPGRCRILNERTCMYRYSIIQSFKDLSDVFYFFSRTYYPDKLDVEHSDRYDYIYVKEETKDKFISR